MTVEVSVAERHTPSSIGARRTYDATISDGVNSARARFDGGLAAFLRMRARPRPGPRHTIETTTPTGHTYISVAPRLSPEVELSPRERMVADVYWAA